MPHLATHAVPDATSVARRRRPVFFRIVRRVHLYAGLLLLPWVLLFGSSGMLFNHPLFGRGARVHSLSPAELHAITGITPRDPDVLARQIVTQLNTSTIDETAAYQVDPASNPRFFGYATLESAGPDARHTITLNLGDASATVSSAPPSLDPDAPPFARQRVDMPGEQLDAIEKQLRALLPALGIADAPDPRASARSGPELRFRIRDDAGRLWNVAWHASTGRLTGRAVDDAPVSTVAELMTRLHKTHEFPSTRNALWVWVLVADIMGACMVTWAVTGLVMWWQLKPTRAIGSVALAAAALAAMLIFSGALSEIQFGGSRGGGDRPQPRPAQTR